MPRSESGKHVGAPAHIPEQGGRAHREDLPDDVQDWQADPAILADLPIEGFPTDDQKNRLEDWLSELRIICRTHGILLDSEDSIRVIDMFTGRVIGIGLAPLLAQRGGRVRLTGYDARDSILDGVWPIETAQGLREQREAGRVWPRHPFRQYLNEE